MSVARLLKLMKSLQTLHLLALARHALPLPLYWETRTVRAILQAAEVCILNLADLMERAKYDVVKKHYGPAMVKLSWR